MWHSIQENMTWRAVPLAGFAAGTVFLLANIILTPLLLEVEADLIIRYFGSLLLGEGVLLEDGSNALIVGILLNYALSLVFTILIAVVVHRWGLLVGVVGGAIMGLAIYLFNLYTLTVFFEWFFAINSNALLISHVLFGMTAGCVYELFDQYDLTRQEAINETTK